MALLSKLTNLRLPTVTIPTIHIPSFVPPLLILFVLVSTAYLAYYFTLSFCAKLLAATQKEIERITAGKVEFKGLRRLDEDVAGGKLARTPTLRGLKVRVRSFDVEDDYLDWTRRTVMNIYNHCEALGMQDTRRLFGVVLPGSAGRRSRRDTFESQRESIDAVLTRADTEERIGAGAVRMGQF